MSERDIGSEILQGIREIKAYKAGKLELKARVLTEPSTPREIRKQLDLSQAAFVGLGAGKAQAQRAGQIVAANSRTAPGSVYQNSVGLD